MAECGTMETKKISNFQTLQDFNQRNFRLKINCKNEKYDK